VATGPARHNIWALPLHPADWKDVVRRRLSDEKRDSSALKGSNGFPRLVDKPTKQAWHSHIMLLIDEREGRGVATCFPVRRLNQRSPRAATGRT
jgi:hypothetical protein